MLEFREFQIPAPNARSLQWRGNELIDWVGGGAVYRLDGTSHGRVVNYAYRFDASATSPSGDFAVIYERLGTKGLLLHHGEILREINRSFYHADIYEFPVAFIRLEDGRELLAHCPDEYCRIDLDEVLTGRRLTAAPTRKPADIFHSCLACDPSGKWLISAGWVWHPWNTVSIYNIQAALSDPTHLDARGAAPDSGAEIDSAVFADERTMVCYSSEETNSERDRDETADPLWRAGPSTIAYYDLVTREFTSISHVDEHPGRIMPLGREYVVGFYDHPKLFEVSTGKIAHRWPHLATGKQACSIQHHIGPVPPVAMDASNRRFAVAGKEAITVVEILSA